MLQDEASGKALPCESEAEATGSFERVVLAGIPSFPRPEGAEDLGGARLVLKGFHSIDLNSFFLGYFSSEVEANPFCCFIRAGKGFSNPQALVGTNGGLR